MDKKQFQRRVYVVSGVLGLLFSCLWACSISFRSSRAPYYRAQAASETPNRDGVEAVRGEILDCNGRVMVPNRSTYQVRLQHPV